MARGLKELHMVAFDQNMAGTLASVVGAIGDLGFLNARGYHNFLHLPTNLAELKYDALPVAALALFALGAYWLYSGYVNAQVEKGAKPLSEVKSWVPFRRSRLTRGL